MRFTTKSGSAYELTEINEQDGKGYDAYLVRDGVPLVDITYGGEMPTLYGQRIYFVALPEVGKSFHYFSKTHAGCISTPVLSIDEQEAPSAVGSS